MCATYSMHHGTQLQTGTWGCHAIAGCASLLFLLSRPLSQFTVAKRCEIESCSLSSCCNELTTTHGYGSCPPKPNKRRSTVGTAAVKGAEKEYGVAGAQKLLQWRKVSHWTNFVPRIITMLHEYGLHHPKGLAQARIGTCISCGLFKSWIESTSTALSF